MRLAENLLFRDRLAPPRIAIEMLDITFPAEYGGFEADAASLQVLAKAGGGRQLEGPLQPVFEADGEHTEQLVARWPLFIWLALVLFVLDLALRRVRWFDAR